MENQFTTTFIPKKPMVADPSPSDAPISRPVGILSSLSLVLFFVMVAISGGVYAWKYYTEQNVADLAESVVKTQKEFEPSSITKLQQLDKQLRNANTLVKNHIVLSPVFNLLESSTLKQVQFNKFDIAFDDTKGFQVKMSGVAADYETIAQQSDALGGSTFLKNVIFSNFTLNQFGKVSFDLSFGIAPEFLNFQTAVLEPDSFTN